MIRYDDSLYLNLPIFIPLYWVGDLNCWFCEKCSVCTVRCTRNHFFSSPNYEYWYDLTLCFLQPLCAPPSQISSAPPYCCHHLRRSTPPLRHRLLLRIHVLMTSYNGVTSFMTSSRSTNTGFPSHRITWSLITADRVLRNAWYDRWRLEAKNGLWPSSWVLSSFLRSVLRPFSTYIHFHFFVFRPFQGHDDLETRSRWHITLCSMSFICFEMPVPRLLV